jgi:peptide deformylase
LRKVKGRVRPVLVYGSPALRKKCVPVVKVTPEIEQLIADLLASMQAREEALALAANQIGELQSVIAVNPRTIGIEQEPFILLNPEVEECGGEIERSEGCLSLPGINEVVKRAAKVKVRAQNARGKPVNVEAEGTLARALLHEIDHLNGVLFIDHLSPARRALLKAALKELEKQSCE